MKSFLSTVALCLVFSSSVYAAGKHSHPKGEVHKESEHKEQDCEKCKKPDAGRDCVCDHEHKGHVEGDEAPNAKDPKSKDPKSKDEK